MNYYSGSHKMKGTAGTSFGVATYTMACNRGVTLATKVAALVYTTVACIYHGRTCIKMEAWFLDRTQSERVGGKVVETCGLTGSWTGRCQSELEVGHLRAVRQRASYGFPSNKFVNVWACTS